MLYPFYHTYNIDDANIGCNRIIVSQCDGTHVYMNPCELIGLCDIPQQLTSDCVVDFLNNLNTQNVGDLIRINSSYCLEAVTIDFNNTDRLVAVDNTDTPGELVSKIVGCNDITVLPIGPAGARQLEICYTGPRTFPDLTDVPSNIYNVCTNTGTNAFLGNYIMVNDTNDGVKSECHYKPIGSMYMADDLIIDENEPARGGSWVNKTVHFFVGNSTSYSGDNGLLSIVTAMNVIGGGSTVRVLTADRDGLWRIWLKGNVRVNPGIQAFRVYVVSNNLNLHGCVDSKFGASANPFQPVIFNKGTAIGYDTESYFNIGGETLVNVNEGDTFAIAVAVSTGAGTGIAPNLKLFSSGLSGGTYDNPLGNMGRRSGISIGFEFIREKPFDIDF